MTDKTRKRKNMSVNLRHALFFLLDLLSLKVGTDKLSRIVCKEIP